MSNRKNDTSPWGKTSRFSIKNSANYNKNKNGFTKEDKERFITHGILPKFKCNHRSEKWLHKKCVPVETELRQEATTILNKVRDKFGNDGSFIEAAYGKRIGVDRASEVIHNYLVEHGVDGMLSVYFSSELDCSGKMSWTGPMNKFNQPERRNFSMWVKTTDDNMYFRETGILNLSNHEIGTHFFRAINDGLQPWYANRTKFGIESFKSIALKDTEEGLASINTAFESKVKYIWGPAMLYYTACMSLEMNFKDLFDHLKMYTADPEVRWKYIVRVKRGRGPNQLGGHGKDQCYFRGAVNILRNVDSINFPLLYSGKITVADQFRIQRIARLDCLKTPYFLRDINNYKRHLRNLLKINGIPKMKPLLIREPELKLKLPKPSRTNLCKEDKFNNNNEQIKKSPRVLMIEARQRILTSTGKPKICSVQESSSAEEIPKQTIPESSSTESTSLESVSQYTENSDVETIRNSSTPKNTKPTPVTVIKSPAITASVPNHSSITHCKNSSVMLFSEDESEESSAFQGDCIDTKVLAVEKNPCAAKAESNGNTEIVDLKIVKTDNLTNQETVIIPSCATPVVSSTTAYRSCVDRPKTPKPKMFKIQSKAVNKRKISPCPPHPVTEPVKLSMQKRETNLTKAEVNSTQNSRTPSDTTMKSKKKVKKNISTFFEELIPFVKSRKKRVLPLP